MSKKSTLQKSKSSNQILPYIIIAIGFIVISAIFCYPWLQGNKLLPHDIFQWLAMSKESRDFYEATGKNAFWTNSMFGGMPSVMTDFYSHTNWVTKFKSLLIAYKHGEMINPILTFFWAMVAFFVFTRSLNINKWLGAIGAVAFAFSSYNPIILSAGHVTKLLDIAFTPGMLAGVIWVLKGRLWKGALTFAIFLALMIDTGHYQIIYYAIFIVIAIGIAYLIVAIRQKTLPQYFIGVGVLTVIAIICAAAGSSRLLMVEEYNHYSMRGTGSELTQGNVDNMQAKKGGLDKDYAFRWSNGIEETLTLMVPNIFGGASSQDIGTESHFANKLRDLRQPENVVEQISKNAPTYWGAQQADGISGPVYFGAIICFLMILSLFVIKSKKKWWLVITAAFFIMLSWGKNFSFINYALFDTLPLFNKFRSPNMAIAMASIMFPALAVWGLNDIINGKWSKEELLQKLKYSVYVAGGIAVLILLSALLFMEYRGAIDDQISAGFGEAANDLMSAIKEDRKSMALKDTFRSLVFMTLAVAVIWAYIKEKLSQNSMILVIGLLVIIDVAFVGKRYLPNDLFLDEYTYEQQFAPRPVDQQILQDKDPYYRVLDLSVDPFNSANQALFHKNVGGYHPAKLQIYQDLILNQISKLNSAVLNMLNTKYIITKGNAEQGIMAIPNPFALGNAWYVSQIQKLPNADAAMQALNAPSIQNPADSTAGSFNPKTTAILFGTQNNAVSESNFSVDSGSYIRLTSYSPRTLEYESNNTNKGFAVFSDIYYPIGWKATIDGNPAEIIRTNYALRGLIIPPGKHKIVFDFQSDTYEKGEKITLLANILLTIIVLLCGIMLFIKWKRKHQNA